MYFMQVLGVKRQSKEVKTKKLSKLLNCRPKHVRRESVPK